MNKVLILDKAKEFVSRLNSVNRRDALEDIGCKYSVAESFPEFEEEFYFDMTGYFRGLWAAGVISNEELYGVNNLIYAFKVGYQMPQA